MGRSGGDQVEIDGDRLGIEVVDAHLVEANLVWQPPEARTMAELKPMAEAGTVLEPRSVPKRATVSGTGTRTQTRSVHETRWRPRS